MARSKPLTTNDLNALADRVQALAIEVLDATQRVDLAGPEVAAASAASAAQKFHQMTEATVAMNNMLLFILTHREDIEAAQREAKQSS